MTIYFKKSYTENIFNYVKQETVPAHEKIGALYTNFLQAEESDRPRLLQELGVSPFDKEAIAETTHLLETIGKGSYKIVPTQNTGVYLIQNEKGENIDVYKVGRKRAATELAVRFLAHELGLDSQSIPGIFCALSGPPLPTKKRADETVEELWDGMEKVILPQKGNSTPTVVGIAQPFLPDCPEASVYDYTLMTMFALAIGLRDGKKDGYKGSKLFDVEDSFPIRMDPVWTPSGIEQSASAVDLPYLDQDDRTLAQLSHEEVEKLAVLVQKWNITDIIGKLKHLKICYEDKLAEGMEEDSKGLDEGGCKVEILKGEPHLINGYLNHLTEENSKRRIFTPAQLDACNTRLQRMRDFVLARAMHKETFTPQELVHAVDKWGKIYQEAIHRSPVLPRTVDYVVKSQGTYHLTGRQSPHLTGVSISPDDYSDHSTPTPPQSDPTPPPSPLVAALEKYVAEEDTLEKGA